MRLIIYVRLLRYTNVIINISFGNLNQITLVDITEIIIICKPTILIVSNIDTRMCTHKTIIPIQYECISQISYRSNIK